VTNSSTLVSTMLLGGSILCALNGSTCAENVQTEDPPERARRYEQLVLHVDTVPQR
jgi:hypothetical protein